MAGSTALPSLQTVQRLEQGRLKLALFRRIILWAIPFCAFAAIMDVIHLEFISKKPILPIQPNLRELEKLLPPVPSLTLSGSLFPSAGPPAQAETAGPTQIAVKDVQWKLKGVLVGPTKQAFLEDAEGKQSVWVTEGEQLGSSKVKEIHEHSVVLETGGANYEIRM